MFFWMNLSTCLCKPLLLLVTINHSFFHSANKIWWSFLIFLFGIPAQHQPSSCHLKIINKKYSTLYHLIFYIINIHRQSSLIFSWRYMKNVEIPWKIFIKTFIFHRVCIKIINIKNWKLRMRILKCTLLKILIVRSNSVAIAIYSASNSKLDIDTTF